MARTAEQLKNELAAFQLYGNGILHPALVEELFATAIAAAEAEATPAEATASPVKRTRKQAE